MQHDLKCYPDYFEALHDGSKTFEYRYNDRDFKYGLLCRVYHSVLSQRTIRTCFNSLCDEYGHISLLDF